MCILSIFSFKHGLMHVSSYGFIQMTNPERAVLSAGYRNRFKHPHHEVIKRYMDRNIQVLETSESGAITLSFLGVKQDKIRVSQFRDNVTGYWYN